MDRLIKWAVVIIVILLIFPGILPAIDRFANNIGLNIPSLSQTFDNWKNRTENAIDNTKDAVNNTISNVQDGINNVKDKVNDIPNALNKNTKPSGTEEIDALIARIEVAEPTSGGYNRDEWEKPVKRFDGMTLRNYGISLSRWTIDNSDSNFKYKDPYTNNIVETKSKLDWDHIIPLAYVYQHGGNEWSKDKKHTYAYDLHIGVATHQTENRKKGADGPSKYMPPENKSAYCYTWFSIADEWDISMTKSDIDTCKDAIYKDIKGAYLIID